MQEITYTNLPFTLRRRAARPPRKRRVICAPADPQPQMRPPEEGQPHVPHGDKIDESDIISASDSAH
jgi:hypothetical protein